MNEDSFTALMISAQNGHDLCARALLEAGAAVDHAAANGATALMLACAGNHELCARALIEAKAEIDKVGPQGFTALMFSASNGHDLCAPTLLIYHPVLSSRQASKLSRM